MPFPSVSQLLRPRELGRFGQSASQTEACPCWGWHGGQKCGRTGFQGPTLCP